MSVYPVEHIWHELVRAFNEYRAQAIMFLLFVIAMIIAVGILLLLSVSALFINPKAGMQEGKPSKLRTGLTYIMFILTGIYDAFFGSAGGIFAMLVLLYGLKTTFLKAHGTNMIHWFTALILTLPFLFLYKLVIIPIGITLIIG